MMKTFYGIADAHGIESFLPEVDALPQLSMLFMRAHSNRQRHACFYKAECSDKAAEGVQRLLKDGKYQLALGVLKSTAIVAVHEDHMKSWPMIPNPKLDPWA